MMYICRHFLYKGNSFEGLVLSLSLSLFLSSFLSNNLHIKIRKSYSKFPKLTDNNCRLSSCKNSKFHLSSCETSLLNPNTKEDDMKYLKGSESDKTDIVLKEASHRQKFNSAILLSRVNTYTNFRKICLRA